MRNLSSALATVVMLMPTLAGAAEPSTDVNPLLVEWTGPYGGVPPFGQIETADFAPALNSILATAIGSGSLPDFTSEAQGQTFAVAAGQFVPEPAAVWLLGCAGAALVGVRRRRG